VTGIKISRGWRAGYFMRIELNNTAKKQLKRINEPYLSAIVAAIDKLECEPT
jgi:mRNA-degrading endonuclease RelE of RelBE toxin-antitoxin system